FAYFLRMSWYDLTKAVLGGGALAAGLAAGFTSDFFGPIGGGLGGVPRFIWRLSGSELTGPATSMVHRYGGTCGVSTVSSTLPSSATLSTLFSSSFGAWPSSGAALRSPSRMSGSSFFLSTILSSLLRSGSASRTVRVLPSSLLLICALTGKESLPCGSETRSQILAMPQLLRYSGDQGKAFKISGQLHGPRWPPGAASARRTQATGSGLRVFRRELGRAAASLPARATQDLLRRAVDRTWRRAPRAWLSPRRRRKMTSACDGRFMAGLRVGDAFAFNAKNRAAPLTHRQIFFAALQLAVQPGAGKGPPALGGGDGDAEGGGVRGGEAGEEAQLHRSGLVRLLGGEPGQDVVEVEQVL